MTATIPADYFEPWLIFKTPVVRQLAFVIASPNILCKIPDALAIKHPFQLHQGEVWQALYQQYEIRLHQLDHDPTDLENFIAELKSTRLGLRFEYLMWFWLKDNAFHHFKLLGHSIQMFHARQTLGEIDFLIFNQHTQQVEHWEVALKYYLAEADFQLQHWYGLNRQDTLLRKLTHFTEKQFQFNQVQDYEIHKRFAVLKGQLYYPAHRLPNHTEDWINTQRRLGQWGRYIPSPAYYCLKRHEWICPDRFASSKPAIWWTNGLYKHLSSEDFFMYRQPHMIHKNV